MLNILRRKKIMKRILWALAIIIIPAFVFWGAGSLTERPLSSKYIGTIDGEKIPFDDFVKSMQDTQVSLFLSYFNQPEILRRFRNDRAFLGGLSWENLIIKEKAKKNKVSVSDEEVINFVTRFPLFARGGAFDDNLYKYILRSSLGMTARTFEESVRTAIVSAKYRESIVKDVTVSEREVRADYREKFEKAKLYYVVIDKNEYKDEIEATEEEIADYYEKNKEAFIEPEKIVLQYIAFPHKEEGAKGKALQELRSAYESLGKPASRMESAAKRLNLTVEKTLPFSRDEIIPEISAIKGASSIAFGLRRGIDIAPLLDENEIGTSYIIRVDEKIPGRIKAKDEVLPSVINAVKDEKALRLAREKAQDIYETGEGRRVSLKKRLRKRRRYKEGLELKETEFVSRHDYIEGVGESHAFVDRAFNLKVGEVSSPIEIRKGFALIEPIELQHIDEEKFREEKEAHEEGVLAAKKMKAFGEWFQKVKANTSLAIDLSKL